MHSWPLLLLLQLPIALFAQSGVPELKRSADQGREAMGRPNAPTDSTHAAGKLDVFPQFPGGDKALFNYLKKAKRMPPEARKLGASGPVVVTFLIDTLGQVHKAQVQRGIGFGCDEEAVRVVNAMPRWSPAMRGGKAVESRYSLPVQFP
ncbi:MAG: energy transducer TonB [Flavobacteriales bacterium]|nr:energy transducer TonB [Flavobacteriales bacterium]